MNRFSKTMRVGVFALICFLHGVLFFNWRDQVATPERRPIRYLTVWNVPAAAPLPEVNSAVRTKAIRPASKARRRIGAAQPAAPQVQVPDHDVQSTATAAIPPPAPTSETPFDMGLYRSLAREDEKRRIKPPLERRQESERASPTFESKVAEAARRSLRKDCQSAYRQSGLLALVPLVIDTVTDSGCKWK